MSDELTDLLPCPFCGSLAESTRPIKPKLEDAIVAEPYINCSRPRCAGRHVCASVDEWQFRQSDARAPVAESPFALTAADNMAKIIDEMIEAGSLDARSRLADARLDYGLPWEYKHTP